MTKRQRHDAGGVNFDSHKPIRRSGGILKQRESTFPNDKLKDLGQNGRIILQWILNTAGESGYNSPGSAKGPVAGFCEDRNEPSWFYKRRGIS
jgi:hypothetical protein